MAAAEVELTAARDVEVNARAVLATRGAELAAAEVELTAAQAALAAVSEDRSADHGTAESGESKSSTTQVSSLSSTPTTTTTPELTASDTTLVTLKEWCDGLATWTTEQDRELTTFLNDKVEELMREQEKASDRRGRGGRGKKEEVVMDVSKLVLPVERTAKIETRCECCCLWFVLFIFLIFCVVFYF